MGENLKYDCFVVAALVDCFARHALLDKAKDLIDEYEAIAVNFTNRKDKKIVTHKAMWMSLLSGCRHQPDKGMTGQSIYEEINQRFHTDESYMASAAILLANIHANHSI